MSDIPVDWDAFDEFINFDPDFQWPAEGFNMQGVGAVGGDGEDTGASAVDTAHSHHTNWPSIERHCLLERSNQPPNAVNWYPSHNDGHLIPEIEAIDPAYDIHRAFHNEYDYSGIGEQGRQMPDESGLPESIYVSSSLLMLPQAEYQPAEVSSSVTVSDAELPSSAVQDKSCACVSCLGMGSFDHPMTDAYHKLNLDKQYHCRYPGCPVQKNHWSIALHERGHYGDRRGYPCGEDHCNYTTIRWDDFRRHTRSKHCTNPANKYPCSVPYCKYSGDNGFARKDKLNSHFKNVHGKTTPGKANQPLKPKVKGGA